MTTAAELRGFASVKRVKARLEAACPGTVSCADILALMARDAVLLAKGPYWPVRRGRRRASPFLRRHVRRQGPRPQGPRRSTPATTATRRGLFSSDAVTGEYVRRVASGSFDEEFFRDFAESMIKMGNVGVLTGDQGEIRTKYRQPVRLQSASMATSSSWMVMLMLVSAAAAAASSSSAAGQLRTGYYRETCPKAEQIVFGETTRIIRASPDMAGALLRLHYHDCFVQGCDASVLLDSTAGNASAERDSDPNKTLRGFDAVARVKDKLEKACPSTVSCADILALMARDAVLLAKGPTWNVPLGRRDGRSSTAASCGGNLPPLCSNVTRLLESFAAKGLDVKDLVVLSGAHTLGVAHCPNFADRLSGDPALDGAYAARLRLQCNKGNVTAEMDPGSFTRFDTSYFRQVARRRALLRSDACLMDNPFTAAYVRQAATGKYDGHFFKDFGESMVKMGAIGVLTGNQGEIRLKCNVKNKHLHH
uniref:peroxidase n=1 Tax=Leersia perrieri TaxID=77586 RepID=A0A0D9WUL1_9ORYZ